MHRSVNEPPVQLNTAVWLTAAPACSIVLDLNSAGCRTYPLLIHIDAKVKYGLPAASGNLISILAALGFIITGILHDADLFLAEYAKRTGASKPGINLL